MAFFVIYFARGIASMYSYRGILLTHLDVSTYSSGLFHVLLGISTSYTVAHSISNLRLNK